LLVIKKRNYECRWFIIARRHLSFIIYRKETTLLLHNRKEAATTIDSHRAVKKAQTLPPPGTLAPILATGSVLPLNCGVGGNPQHTISLCIR
jgi:hypothetical protein